MTNLDKIAEELNQSLLRRDGNPIDKIKSACEKVAAIVVSEMKEQCEASDYEYEKQLNAQQQDTDRLEWLNDKAMGASVNATLDDLVGKGWTQLRSAIDAAMKREVK